MGEIGKRQFENRVGRAMVDRPFLDRAAKYWNASASVLAVFRDHGAECLQVDQLLRQCAADGSRHFVGIVDSEIAQCSRKRGARNLLFAEGPQPPTVRGAMHRGVRKARMSATVRIDHMKMMPSVVDEAPEIRGGTMRCKCTVTNRHH